MGAKSCAPPLFRLNRPRGIQKTMWRNSPKPLLPLSTRNIAEKRAKRVIAQNCVCCPTTPNRAWRIHASMARKFPSSFLPTLASNFAAEISEIAKKVSCGDALIAFDAHLFFKQAIARRSFRGTFPRNPAIKSTRSRSNRPANAGPSSPSPHRTSLRCAFYTLPTFRRRRYTFPPRDFSCRNFSMATIASTPNSTSSSLHNPSSTRIRFVLDTVALGYCSRQLFLQRLGRRFCCTVKIADESTRWPRMARRP